MSDVKERCVEDNPSFTERLRHVVPVSARPIITLLRFDRPAAVWLLLLPCWWSMSLGVRSLSLPSWDIGSIADFAQMTNGQTILSMATLFAIGAVLMRGAGCIINDIFDRNIDRRVERTRGRPLACGALSLTSAVVCVGSVMLVSFFILLQFNLMTVSVALLSVPMFVIYPLMKRITHWPQAWLGLTFSWGALLGWTAVTGVLSAPAVVLYIGCFFWILGYDTLYAHQDREDDIAAQVGSLAILLGRNTTPVIAGSYTISFCLFLVAGTLVDFHWAFYFFMIFPACHLIWQVTKIDIQDRERCWTLFASNRMFGLLILLAFVAGHVDTFVERLGFASL